MILHRHTSPKKEGLIPPGCCEGWVSGLNQQYHQLPHCELQCYPGSNPGPSINVRFDEKN
jgi:hypothetical protein